MYSLAVTAPEKVELVEIGRPKVGDYGVLVKTEISFICNSTDGKIIAYHMPGLGRENYPLVLGHESVGRVVEVGPKVRNFKVGGRAIGGLVFEVDGPFGSGWGGHSEYTLIEDIYAMLEDNAAPEDYNETYKIMAGVPDDIPIEAAGLLCTWREVYSGFFDDFGAKPCGSLVIFGCGPVGLSFVRFAKLSGFKNIIAIDPLNNKRLLAKKMGADITLAPDEVDGYFAANKKADMIIDAVGSPAIINKAVSLIAMNGKVCVFGVVGDDEFTLKKADGPYNFNMLIHQWPTRDFERAAIEPLLKWIRSGELDYRDFVTSRFGINEAQKAVEEVKKPDNIKTMLIFDR